MYTILSQLDSIGKFGHESFNCSNNNYQDALFLWHDIRKCSSSSTTLHVLQILSSTGTLLYLPTSISSLWLDTLILLIPRWHQNLRSYESRPEQMHSPERQHTWPASMTYVKALTQITSLLCFIKTRWILNAKIMIFFFGHKIPLVVILPIS